ncbi:AI-2E family transporter, partial [Mariniblastus sp.]|nr:AI-2E family transporter [Mariniblastus sp.]
THATRKLLMSKKKRKRKPSPASPKPKLNTDKRTNVGSAERSESNVSRYISFGLLLGVIAIVGLLFYEVMAHFLIPLFLSAILVVVFRPLHRWIINKSGGREKLAAALTTLSVLLTVLAPLTVIFFMAAIEGKQVYNDFNATKITDGFYQVRSDLKLDMPCKNELRKIGTELTALKSSTSFSPTDEDRFQISLFEIEEAGKKLARVTGRDWPIRGELDETPLESRSTWDLFAADLIEARTLHEAIPAASIETGQSRNQAIVNYHEKINQTVTDFNLFESELLGGKARAWLIKLVNPSDEESKSYANSVVGFLQDKLLQLTGAGVSYAGNLLVGAAIMVIGLYFFLLDGPRLIEAFKGLSPIDDAHEQELVAEFGTVSRAVVVATLASALAQGLLAGIGFYFTGFDSVFLLTVISAMLAMVPFVGAAAVWIPCCFYLLFFDSNVTAAIGLGIYGIAFISMADNVIKPYILHGQSNIHPLFALLSVLGGVSTLGPIGIVIGPMVVAFLQTLLKILQREMTHLDQITSPPVLSSESTGNLPNAIQNDN